jgi:hypothetical protein
MPTKSGTKGGQRGGAPSLPRPLCHSGKASRNFSSPPPPLERRAKLRALLVTLLLLHPSNRRSRAENLICIIASDATRWQESGAHRHAGLSVSLSPASSQPEVACSPPLPFAALPAHSCKQRDACPLHCQYAETALMRSLALHQQRGRVPAALHSPLPRRAARLCSIRVSADAPSFVICLRMGTSVVSPFSLSLVCPTLPPQR